MVSPSMGHNFGIRVNQLQHHSETTHKSGAHTSGPLRPNSVGQMGNLLDRCAASQDDFSQELTQLESDEACTANLRA